MAVNRGQWKLVLTGNEHDELSDCDLEHIGNLIKKGFTSGEVCQDEEDCDPDFPSDVVFDPEEGDK